MDGRMDGLDGQMGWMDGCMAGWMDGMNGIDEFPDDNKQGKSEPKLFDNVCQSTFQDTLKTFNDFKNMQKIV